MEVFNLLISTMICCFLLGGGLAFVGTIARLDIFHSNIPSSFYHKILKAIGLTFLISFLSVLALINLPLKRNSVCLEKKEGVALCSKESFESLYVSRTGFSYEPKTIIRSF